MASVAERAPTEELVGGNTGLRTWKTERLLPVHNFLVTFTVPETLRMTLRANQRVGYQALFDGGSGTIRELATTRTV